ncbi:MAG: NAD-dependent epimerase/dehydratase family protein, partial [Planctomycetes bacterium]|nr:NAD-dependent epimerase/dehydratase family protein [Planctomycetota bacterium]
ASSREIFGTPKVIPQNEDTAMNPNSPYGAAKAFATQMVKIYRQSHGLHFCNAICFNHESPRRAENFVTRKISLAAARIKMGLQRELLMGSIDSARDWGYAAEFVDAMWRMLQQDKPDDYVLATGRSHTVRDFMQLAFEHVGLDWRNYYRLDPRFARPADPENLLGDATHAKDNLGWEAQTSLAELAGIMVDHDLAMLSATGNESKPSH